MDSSNSSLAILRANGGDPRVVTSTTDGEKTEPARVRPSKSMANPIPQKLCMGKKKPRCKRSGTSVAKPKHLKLLANSDGSESVELTTNSEKTEPTLVKPRIGVAKPRSMQLRKGGGKSI